MPLVAASDFEDLPQQPEARWLQLRDLLERRLDDRFDWNNGGTQTYDTLEYVQVLTAAAEELGIGTLKDVPPSNIHEDFDAFRADVAALATRLSLRIATQSFEHSVAIARPTRKKILTQIETLRAAISNSELSNAQKRKATKQIDQLQILVIAERTDITKVGVILAAIGAFAVGTTSLLADLPPAVGTISSLIGAEKQEEEEDKIFIEKTREKLQIEDLRESSDESADSSMEDSSPDEIPF